MVLVMDANDDPPSQSLGGTYAVSTAHQMRKHSAGQIRSVMNRSIQYSFRVLGPTLVRSLDRRLRTLTRASCSRPVFTV
jgi:hypothetical protein